MKECNTRSLPLLSFFLTAFVALTAFGQVGHDGSFSHNIPIQIPTGAHDTAPQLSLNYSSNAGNGPLGRGWSLQGLPTITRVNKGDGIRYDGSDTYLSDLGILVDIQGDGSLFHTQQESWVRYEPQYDEACSPVGEPCSWTVRDRNGNTFYFGLNEDARVRTPTQAIRVWALSRAEDVDGNAYEVSYLQDAGAWYPERVVYTSGNGLTTFRSVTFHYESRDDAYLHYRQSAPVEINQRMNRIDVHSGDSLVRSYHLDYEASPVSERSRLVSVQEYGSDGVSALPAWRFEWQNIWREITDVRRDPLPASWAGYAVYASGDFNGDGIDDLYLNSNLGAEWQQHIRYGRSNGRFRDVSLSPLHPSWQDYVVHGSGDFNGDGFVDLYLNHQDAGNTTYQHIWYGRAADGFRDFQFPPRSSSLGGLSVRSSGDFNGDGFADLLLAGDTLGGSVTLWYGQAGDGFREVTLPVDTLSNYKVLGGGDFNGDGYGDLYLHRNDTTGSADPQYVWYGRREDGFTAYSFDLLDPDLTRYKVYGTGDMNGDGLSDLYLNGENLGDGRVQQFLYGTPEGFRSETYEPLHASWNDYQVLGAGDFNGDGMADLYLNRTNLGAGAVPHLFLGRHQGGFRDLELPIHDSSYSNYRIHAIGDFTGEGHTDLYLNHANLGGGAAQHLWVGAGQRPDLMVGITTPGGARQLINYHAAPRLDQAVRPDLDGVNGEGDRANKHPRMLVHTLWSDSGNGEYTDILYTYENGRILYRPGSVRDLGFARITKTRNHSRETELQFRQDLPFQGRMTALRVLDRNTGQAVETTTYDYAHRAPFPGVDNVVKTLTTTSLPEGGLTMEETHDAYGFPLQRTETVDTHQGPQTLVTDYVWSHDTASWRLGQLDEKRTTLSGGNVVSWDRLSYNSRGDLMAKQSLLCDDAENCNETAGRWQTMSQNFTYDAHGNLTGFTNAAGHTTRVAYDPVFHALPVSHTNAAGHRVEREYDAPGRLTKVTDANGNATCYTYDVFGRRTSATDARGNETEFSYVDWGDLNRQHIETRFADGSWERRYFDGLMNERRVERSGANGQTIVKFLEKGSSENSIYETTHHFAGENYRYNYSYFDSNNRPTMFYGTGDRITRYNWSTGSVTRQDESGSQEVSYDTRGKVFRITNAQGQAVDLDYDAAGRLKEIQAGYRTELNYNNRGLKTRQDDDVFGRTDYEYDDLGRQTSIVDAAGNTILYRYDALNRLTRKITATGETVFTYDDPGVANSLGRLTRVESPDAVIEMTYDVVGNVIATRTQLTGLQRTFIRTIEYDAANRPIRITLPDGSLMERDYDAAGNLSEILLDGRLIASFSGYTASGRFTTRVIGAESANQITTTYTYDVRDLLRTLTTTHADGTLLQHLTYTYDQVGNVLSVGDQRQDTVIDGVDTDASQSFVYDAISQLTQATGVYGLLDFGYDGFGNITSLGGNQTNRAFRYDGPRLVSGDGFTAAYDAVGNMVARHLDGTDMDLAYDENNRLVAIHKDGRLLSRFGYDHTGVRVRKEAYRADGSQVTTWYVGRDLEIRRDSLQDHEKQTLHIQGPDDRKIVSITRRGDGSSDDWWYYHDNHLGSTSLITDQEGVVTARINYLPYGQVDYAHSTGDLSVTHLYTGQELDDESGLIYYGARYYDPAIGRFLTPDTIVPDGGNLLGYNRYAYVQNNPIRYTDPSGHFGVSFGGGGGIRPATGKPAPLASATAPLPIHPCRHCRHCPISPPYPICRRCPPCRPCPLCHPCRLSSSWAMPSGMKRTRLEMRSGRRAQSYRSRSVRCLPIEPQDQRARSYGCRCGWWPLRRPCRCCPGCRCL